MAGELNRIKAISSTLNHASAMADGTGEDTVDRIVVKFAGLVCGTTKMSKLSLRLDIWLGEGAFSQLHTLRTLVRHTA